MSSPLNAWLVWEKRKKKESSMKAALNSAAEHIQNMQIIIMVE